MATKRNDIQKAIESIEKFVAEYPEDTVSGESIRVTLDHVKGVLNSMRETIENDSEKKPLETVTPVVATMPEYPEPVKSAPDPVIATPELIEE